MSLNAQGRMEIGLHVCSEAGVHGTVVKRVGKWWHVALEGASNSLIPLSSPPAHLTLDGP